MNITFSRKDTRRPILIFYDNTCVGSIEGSLTETKKFVLQFRNAYFAPDGRLRVNNGGNPVRWFNTLKEAKEHAIKILEVVSL